MIAIAMYAYAVVPMAIAVLAQDPEVGRIDISTGGAMLMVDSPRPMDSVAKTLAQRYGLVGGGATSIVFHRDQAGKVTGLSAGDDRVWDLRFTRVAAAAR
jgi:hypothetical protein